MESKSKKILAEEYKISRSTLRRWLKIIPDLKLSPFQKILNPIQVEIVYKYYGNPKTK